MTFELHFLEKQGTAQKTHLITVLMYINGLLHDQLDEGSQGKNKGVFRTAGFT